MNLPLYQNHYQSTNYILFKSGKIYSRIKNKFLKNRLNNHGYVQLVLKINSKKTNRLLHREIAKTFLPNPNNYREVDHKDRNTYNNNLNNLRWCSRSQNCLNRKCSNKEKYIYIVNTPNGNIYNIKIRKKGNVIFRTTKHTLESAIEARDIFLKDNQHIIDDDF